MKLTDPLGVADLSTCDREPIHLIGRIQSFGWLISCSGDWMVNHLSANCEELFGRPARELIGYPIASLVSPNSLHAIRTQFQMLAAENSVQRMFEADVFGDGRKFDLAIHKVDESYVIELEIADRDGVRDCVVSIRPMMDRLRRSSSVVYLCDTAARMFQDLTGFDRVMIYRFGPSGAGEVIAESRTEAAGSYLGLHFPASDIPAQARALYAKNLFRIIADVDDPTVRVIPETDRESSPLDLSMSGLRAVSPVHIEYLRNMGVKASMSVSIMRRGKLWGLIACHNYAPHHLPYSLRTAAELFGEFFAFVLDQCEADQVHARLVHSARLHDDIMARLAAGHSLINNFDEFAEMIGSFIPIDGIAGWIDGQFVSQGSVPTPEEFGAVSRLLDDHGGSRIWSTEHLGAMVPDLHPCAARFAGLLAIPVSRMPRDYIVLFRKEYVHDVQWAGNPEKVVEPGSVESRFVPRKSFELWKQERRGHCRRWDPVEIEAAESLRVTLLEVVLQMADAASKDRERASKHQKMLIAELNHRVRNILNLIKGLVGQSKAGSTSIEGFAEILGSRIYALARAHDQITQSKLAPSSLQDLIRTEGAAYLGGEAPGLAINGLDAMIEPQGFMQLALLIHELMTNSAKYGALSVLGGNVSINLSEGSDGSLELHWCETGGPPVAVPKRRGFGSMIIEKSIPHELGGQARLDFRKEGLAGHFVIPANVIAYFAQTGDDAGRPAKIVSPVAKRLESVYLGRILVLEDNIIIAMEIEDMLRKMGFSEIELCGSEESATQVLDGAEIKAALLDVNLGGTRTSIGFAEHLQSLGIPFVFASGYSEVPGHEGKFAGAPILTKPFTFSELEAALVTLDIL